MFSSSIFPSLNHTYMKYGTALARKSKHQKAIKKINIKIKKPISFIMINFVAK
jgi:hypothetical protein